MKLSILNAHEISVYPNKVKLFHIELLYYLGHIISHNEVKIDDEITVALRNFREPKNKKDIGPS